MANNCLFDFKIVGKEENVDELMEMMKWKGKFKENGLGRIYEISIEYKDKNDNGTISAYGYGDCAWSVLTAMMAYKDRNPSLESETKRLNLEIEIYSSEPGCCFQEHIIIDKGELCLCDCVDYEEHWIAEFDTLEEYNEECGTDFTEDMVDDEYVKIGGFADYGVWTI